MCKLQKQLNRVAYPLSLYIHLNYIFNCLHGVFFNVLSCSLYCNNFVTITYFSLGLESRRPSSPLIDIKPIEFGAFGSKKEIVQPTVLRKIYTPEDYFRKFEPHLYPVDSSNDDVDSLTNDEILTKYQLGMLHFSTQYDLLHNYLTVRVIEARDLPPPISYDGSRQDMAHSNPYVKICLLPDQKNSKQTGVKRKTQNPVYEERYTFEIPFLEAQRRTLLLTVVDFDKFSRHCVIGKVSMPLSEVDLVKGGHWWKAIIPSSQVGFVFLFILDILKKTNRLNDRMHYFQDFFIRLFRFIK